MLNISSAVKQVISTSDFALEGLQTDCLNLTAYAQTIHKQVENMTKKPVQKTSIVVALSRLAKNYSKQTENIRDFKLHNLVSRTGLTELTYTKTPLMQTHLAELHKRTEIQSAPFFVVVVGLTEISIIINTDLATLIRQELSDIEPTLHLDGLSSLTVRTDPETINTPRQSYTVIKQLALRDITMVEYITSASELTIILYNQDLKESFVILHDKFFK